MSRKRSKNKAKIRASKPTPEVEAEAAEVTEITDVADDAVVEGEVLAEGSGPHEALEAAIDEAAEEIAAQYESGSDEVAAMADALEASAELAAAAEHVGEAGDETSDETGEVSDAAELEGDEAAAELPTSAASMEPGQLKLLVEALVFASDKPITVQRLRQLTRIADTKKLEATLLEIQADYEHRGLILSSVSGGWQFRTRPQFSAWVQQLIAGRPVRLSRAQLETLAIVAYRQPITRPEIDEIRGVDSSATLKLLLDRALIRVLGKKEEVGRPMLYGTTKEFLDFFSLADLRELPTLREYSELTDESRQVITNKLGPSDDDGSGGSGGDGGTGSGDGGPLGDGGEASAEGEVATSFDAEVSPEDALRAWSAEPDVPAPSEDAEATDEALAASHEGTDEALEASHEGTDEATDEALEASAEASGESVAASPDGTDESIDPSADVEVAGGEDTDALSRLAARMLASDDAPDAPDAELANGSGPTSAELRADGAPDDSEPDDGAGAPDAVEAESDADAQFAAGSRAFAAVTDAEAAELAAAVADELRDDRDEPGIDEAAAPAMLVATDDIVDGESPGDPAESAESE